MQSFWVKCIQKWQNQSFLSQIWSCRPLKRPMIHQRAMLDEGPKTPKSPHKLVLPENISISAFYTVIMGEIDPKVAKLVNLSQMCNCRLLIRLIIHQMVMLEGPETPKSSHKLVLPENVSINAFYTVILGEMDPKVAKLVNLAQIGCLRP